MNLEESDLFKEQLEKDTSRKKAIINNRDQEFITLIGYAIYIDELQISLRRQGKRP